MSEFKIFHIKMSLSLVEGLFWTFHKNDLRSQRPSINQIFELELFEVVDGVVNYKSYTGDYSGLQTE